MKVFDSVYESVFDSVSCRVRCTVSGDLAEKDVQGNKCPCATDPSAVRQETTPMA